MKRAQELVELTNPDKVLFPTSGITKGELVDYYERVYETASIHLSARPVALHRLPDGLGGSDFFQKRVPDHIPDWIERVEVERKEQEPIEMVVVDNRATVRYLANQGCVALHVWPSCRGALDTPDRMIFDLDPGQGGFAAAVSAARAIRHEIEDERGLRSFVMTSGSQGLHVAVPLKADAPFEAVRDYARAVCETVAEEHPDEFTIEPRKEKRDGRLFLDYLRNAHGQHSIAPYSLRALEGAPVATPLDWEELGNLSDGAQTYTTSNLFRRLAQKGDPWAEIEAYASSVS